MSKYATIFRPLNSLQSTIDLVQIQLDKLKKSMVLENQMEIIDFFQVKDALITHLFFLKAILNYHLSNGKTRGSYLIFRKNLNDNISEMYIKPPNYLKDYKFIHNKINLSKKIQTLMGKNNQIIIEWEDMKEIPSDFGWFENIWKEFTKK
jgi:hypothetical protein